MKIEIALNGSAAVANRYVSWAPVAADIRLSDLAGVRGPIAVKLRSAGATRTGGRVEFYAATPGAAVAELSLTLPKSGKRVKFSVAGKFGRPSVTDRDAGIDVVNAATGAVLLNVPLMVRVRKNATALTTGERDRFVSAFAQLNNGGQGRFQAFREVHMGGGIAEAHSNPGFLPWHRAFVLDLERELQKIDPSVALHYWRFDQPAPKLFNRAFLGVSSSTGEVQFATSNPLSFWRTDGPPGINRSPEFNTGTQPAHSVVSEAQTLALGGAYASFRTMEGNPHGSAHSAFGGSISGLSTAAMDPLFFMLHCNVDRLWAKWQWVNHRFDTTKNVTFTPRGKVGDPGGTQVGHNMLDTMWPWNQITASPRPPTAPGGSMAPSALVKAPGLKPTVGSMIDYQGVHTPAGRLGFDYDDVPFEFVN